MAVRCFSSAVSFSCRRPQYVLPAPGSAPSPCGVPALPAGPGVGDDEDSIEAGSHLADFVNQLRHIDGGGLPDGSAADTLTDKSLTGTPYPTDLFVEVGKFLVRQPDVDSVCSASHWILLSPGA